MTGRYTFAELPPYRYPPLPRVFTVDRVRIVNGMLYYTSDVGLSRTAEASHFQMVTPLAKRLIPDLQGVSYGTRR